MNPIAAPLGAPAPETASAVALAARLWLVVGGLRHVIAAWGGRDRASVPLVVLVWGRVGRLATRFEALMRRLAAGKLAPPRVRTMARAAVRPAPGDAHLTLPRGFGWLGQALPEARAFGSQLQALLQEPEMAALLATCPRAGRVLRPLRHMLGIAEPGAPVRDPKPMRMLSKAGLPASSWWQAAQTAVSAAPPLDYAPFPPGRAPPWVRG